MKECREPNIEEYLSITEFYAKNQHGDNWRETEVLACTFIDDCSVAVFPIQEQNGKKIIRKEAIIEWDQGGVVHRLGWNQKDGWEMEAEYNLDTSSFEDNNPIRMSRGL